MKHNLAIIPARSGSKGVKDKNIHSLNGKPLIDYTIREAIASKCFEDIIVSTDSKEYAKIAIECGAKVPFLRSEDLSSDTASSWDVVRDVVEKMYQKGKKYEYIALLQPTSPLREAKDIIAAFELQREREANAILSVVEMEHSPLWSNTLPSDCSMDNFRREEYADLPRQQLPKYYRLNGAIYLFKPDELYKDAMFKEKTYAYIMPMEKSVDIDSEMDFEIAEMLMKKGRRKEECF